MLYLPTFRGDSATEAGNIWQLYTETVCVDDRHSPACRPQLRTIVNLAGYRPRYDTLY